MDNTSKLSPVALGLALGFFWGISVLLTGLIAYYFAYGVEFVMSMRTIYVGYEPTIGGSLIGGVFGLVDGFIGGGVIALLYNCFLKCCRCCKSSKKS